jgi:hypothetical protein
MVFMKLSAFLLSGFFLFSFPALANEHEAAPAEAKDGGDAKARREYQDKSSRLKMYDAKISGAEHEIMALAVKKDQEKDPKAQKEIMNRMVGIVMDRNKTAEQYNALKTELAYRYPSQGEALDRSYRTQSKKSLEEIEGSVGLDELLTNTKKMIDRKYAPFVPPKEVTTNPAAASTRTIEDQRSAKKTSSEGPSTKPANDEDKPTRLRMER